MSGKAGSYYFSTQWLRRVIASTAVLLGMLTVVMAVPFNASASSTATLPAKVTVNAQHGPGRIPATALGVNNAVWDSHLQDAVVPSLLQQAGVKVMRYPGGSTSDTYHWQTNTIEPGNTSAGANDFDAFMRVVHQTGAQAMVTANYGSGTPAEAAAWVKYANITKHYHVQYWEIGNEIYGNGSYGANWEYDTHAQKGPAAYANNALQFVSAMKAVDPTIKIGIVLTMPGDWPDGVVASGDTQDWNHTVLSIVGSKMDFAAVHWYADYASIPGNESDAGLLGNTAAIPGKVATLHSLINQYCGNRAGQVKIDVTETNSVPYNPGKQTVSVVNALFLDDDYMTWLENGVNNVDWWDTHNGIVTYGNNSPTLFGNTTYGDYGMLSAGNSDGGVSEPPANTPFPTYYGLQMVSHLVQPYNRMLTASSTQSLVTVHAVRQLDDSIAVLLINKDPNNSYSVDLSQAHPGHVTGATVYSYGANSTGGITVTHVRGNAAANTQTIAPYSLTTVVFSGDD
ncbi:alpha-L-arabinofuranosidase [Dictyobacter sp. S3.2.2.5]|uniref:Alpha-L-arabinofuranosidase n=1 Tax=Dictyobacter halimunensis TaxID=3026934 RepID=A0ABQ6FVX6_9CHLR|nr:alpha-L-arabinofuranosidase [Dictyobacter sp. S3.2.2.5]